MDALLEGKIDFVGQKTVENVVKLSLPTVTAISFVAGFATQSMQVTFGVLGLSVIALALVIVPPWPGYNSHPVKWLPIVDQKKTQ